jgi:hypothetical protein
MSQLISLNFTTSQLDCYGIYSLYNIIIKFRCDQSALTNLNMIESHEKYFNLIVHVLELDVWAYTGKQSI